MSELETRRVAVIPKGGLEGAVPWGKQEAIPWCTTHDDFAHDTTCSAFIVAVEHDSDVPAACVISMGGPDHKWWVDI